MLKARASDVWVASIEPKVSAVDRAAAVAVNVIGLLLSSPLGDGSTKDAVIRRRDSGEELLRGGAGHDVGWMLDQLQRDLKSMSEESFTAKRRNGTDWTITLRNLG
jgi:hypothetical protein